MSHRSPSTEEQQVDALSAITHELARCADALERIADRLEGSAEGAYPNAPLDRIADSLAAIEPSDMRVLFSPRKGGT